MTSRSNRSSEASGRIRSPRRQPGFTSTRSNRRMSRAGTGVVVGMTAAGAVVSSMVVVRIALARQAAYARRVIGKPLGEDALEGRIQPVSATPLLVGFESSFWRASAGAAQFRVFRGLALSCAAT